MKKNNNALVYVRSIDEKPLMPTRNCAKVRILLKEKRARVVSKNPFTIQLLYETGNHTQPITLGVDPGYEYVGLSASTEKEELYSSEIKIRTDIKSKLESRRRYRRSRRSRKCRHRKARFNNRKSSKPKGWVPPTVTQKVQSHINEIRFVCSILPITKVVIERSAFDIQKVNNPSISGKEYQNGPQKGFDHTREYVLYRDKHTCQHCRGKSGSKILTTHHIIPTPKGTNRADNLITLCDVCHKAYHAGEIELNAKAPRKFNKAETLMNIMRYRLVKEIEEVFGLETEITYAAETKKRRIKKGYKKSHAIDALMISGNVDAKPSKVIYKRYKYRAHNRQIHRAKPGKGGIRRRAQTDYEMFGFRLYDRVLLDNRELFVRSRRSRGTITVSTIDGSFRTDVSYKEPKLLEKAKSTITIREVREIERTAS